MHVGKSMHRRRAGEPWNDIRRSRHWCTTNGNHGVARSSSAYFVFFPSCWSRFLTLITHQCCRVYSLLYFYLTFRTLWTDHCYVYWQWRAKKRWRYLAWTTCNCYTHTHTRLTALCLGLPGWAGTRKVKPIWILLKQETVSGSGIRRAICKSAPRSRQITTPVPHRSVFYRPDALPAAQPTASRHWRNC